MEKEKMNRRGEVLESKKKKRKVGIGVLSILLVLVLLLGLSYAWFTLTLSGTKQNVIKVGKLSLVLSEGDAITIENAVPTYTEVALQGDSYHFTIKNDGTTEASYSLYLDPTGEVTTNVLLRRFYYALKKDGKIINISTLDTIKDASIQSGIISPQGESEYDLYIWYGANNTVQLTQTYQSTLRIESEQPKSQKLLQYVMHACDDKAECTRVDQGVTYFQQDYYGLSPKYVWYSGKLWIVTGYDHDGNVKMTTVDPQTIIPWGTTSDYQGSHVETWINEEFLPTLNNYQNLLVTDQVWNYSKTTGGCVAPIGTDQLVTSPVGMLNSWDIYQAGDLDSNFNSADLILAKMGSSYLGNATSNGSVCVGGFAAFSYQAVAPNTNEFFGVSPAVVLRNDVIVISGTGTKEDPYRLKGDDYGKKDALLNTRYVGEYVAFGDNINYSYRISKVENGAVKLISSHPLLELFIDKDDKDKEYIYLLDTGNIDKETFEQIYLYPYKAGTGDLLHYSANDRTNYPFGYFLNHSFLSPGNGFLSVGDKTMILENQTWYTGTVKGGESYKKAKDSTNQVIATVALPYIGDASSVFQSGDKKTGTMFNNVNNVTFGGIFLTNNGTDLYAEYGKGSGGAVILYEGISENGWRPTFYLKSNVKIKSGSGTKLDPYILTME